MKHFEVFLAVMLLPLPVLAADHAIPARVATLTIDPREVTILNLRPEFESSIRIPWMQTHALRRGSCLEQRR
jgi:hypothetical protein